MFVFDAHVHCSKGVPVRESVALYQKSFALNRTKWACFCAIPHTGNKFHLLQNLQCLYYKLRFSPNGYAMAGLEHDFSLSPTQRSRDFLHQAQRYHKMGFDGMKMLEGQPSLRKSMALSLCDPSYDDYYAYLEEHRIPVLLHLANPKEYWDESRVPANARALGRFCDSSYPSYEQFYQEMFSILDKHPKLRLCLAHWGFFSEDRDRAQAFLSYENTSLDITPGGEQLYRMQSTDMAGWVDFYHRYAKRIRYGADSYNVPLDNETRWTADARYRHDLLRNFFDGDGTQTYHYDSFDYYGIALDEATKALIYRENALREFGDPRPVDIASALAMAEEKAPLCVPGSVDEYDLFCIQNDLRPLA